MINLGDFSIVVLTLDNASSLSKMLLKNTKRFQRYFPKTLEQNLTLEMTKAYILKKNRFIESGEEYTFGLKENSTNSIIGLAIIKNINREIQDAEVAYCLDVDYGGKGLTTKAVTELCQLAKEKYQLKSLFILAHKTNHPSVRVAEKTGFSWNETQFKSYTPFMETKPIDMEKFVKIL